MSTTTDTAGDEVEGSLVLIVHVDNSSTEPTRTALALTTKDDLSLTVDEDNEDINLSAERRTRRYRTNNSVDLEVASAIDVDMEAAELIGIADSDGGLSFDTGDRQINAADDAYIEVAYFTDESDSYDLANAELIHRFEDLKLASPEIDPSATPPLLSWTWWVEGTITLSYDISEESA